jgi:hypothetical protein
MPKSSIDRQIRLLCTFVTLGAFGLNSAACIDDENDEDEFAEKQPIDAKKPKKLKPLCIDDQCTDELVETRLNYTIQNFEFPGAAFAVGTKLRIFGHEYPCFDSPCAMSWAVIRDFATGELISAYFGKPYPSAQVLSNYGETPESWLAPLTVDAGDHGNCEPYDSGCGDGTVLQRGAVDFTASEQTARILDGTSGWAPAGYYANVSDWTLGDASCQYALWSGRANVIRASCEGDCPGPDFAEGCGPTVEPHDGFSIKYLGLIDYAEGSFDGVCQVVSLVDQQVSLDCAYSDPPGIFEEPAE